MDNYNRIKKTLNSLQNNSIAIIFGSCKKKRNGDNFYYPFRQSSGFYYLTGIYYPDSLLVLEKDSSGKSNILLLIYEPSAREKIYAGYFPSPNDIKSKTKLFDEVEYLNNKTHHIILEKIKFYKHKYVYNEDDYYENMFFNDLRNYILKYNPFDLSDWLTKMRLIKTDDELDLIRKAIDITLDTLKNVAKNIQEGETERDLYALLHYNYLKEPDTFTSFEPIVATGKNAITLHYQQHNGKLKNGELLLIDTGAEYKGYAADITRVFPVNGHFSAQQLKVYNAVLEVQIEMIKKYKHGTTINELNIEADKLMCEQLVKLGLLNKKDCLLNENKIKYYYPHGLTHFLGLDVHDVGDKNTILKPGMILTCEPGLYIPEWEMGIRIEDDILITENEPVNLSEKIPKYYEDIEKLMIE